MLALLYRLWSSLNTSDGWKPEGDSEGVNWLRCKTERWEKERREVERRVNDVPVAEDRRSGTDRRQMDSLRGDYDHARSRTTGKDS